MNAGLLRPGQPFAVVVGLGIACIVTAMATGPATLFVGLCLLRLTGQGLMVHVEATATARAFDRERGRALGITALGIPVSEVVFPPLAVAGIAAIGWRPTYALIGAIALFVLLPFTQWLLYGITRSPRREGGANGAFRSLLSGLRVMLSSRYVWAALPAMAIFPFSRYLGDQWGVSAPKTDVRRSVMYNSSKR